MPTIDLENWIMPDYDAIPLTVEQGGKLTQPGRVSWFIPTSLIKNDLPEIISYSLFTKQDDNILNQFNIERNILKDIIKYVE